MMPSQENDEAVKEAIAAFEREVGVSGLNYECNLVGTRQFIKFVVGREAPLYTHALHATQQSLAEDNPFRGSIGITAKAPSNFPASVEANALLTLLTRSTREVSQGGSLRGYVVPYVPFQRREDHQLAQPASHIVRGRRGVGKSTLIRRAIELLSETSAIFSVLDMQSYSTLTGTDLQRETLLDACRSLSEMAAGLGEQAKVAIAELEQIGDSVSSGTLSITRAPAALKRALTKLTAATQGGVFLFLDDFHLIEHDSQPELLNTLHAALKGANGWLKVAGLSSLLNPYSPATRHGLQVPGDAQFISLDLTLENPEAAERHLRAILEGFLKAVGYSNTRAVIPDAAFRRLVWANAGVPRDFLQMFGRSLEHAQRNRRSTITLSDVNIAIGEFGQQKMDDLQKDARNEAGAVRKMLSKLEVLCLDEHKVNGFLVRNENSKERSLVQILSDLRMIHLIHQSITPHRAGERFEAYILDYSLFTGFRRRPNVREMLPQDPQFRAAELRALPRVQAGFFAEDAQP